MKRLLIALAIGIIGLNSPIFSHRYYTDYSDGTWDTYRTHYSVWDCIEMDVSEGQFTLPQAIAEDLF